MGLLKVIKKKLVRKALDMIKKIDAVDYLKKFWKEYSTKYVGGDIIILILKNHPYFLLIL